MLNLYKLGIPKHIILSAALALLFLVALPAMCQQSAPIKVTIDWSKSNQPLKTVPTLQVVVNPLLRRGSPIHDAAFAALKQLGADDVRYVPWHPYPRLAVAELEPPTNDSTSWNFSLIDPMTLDFLNATKGHDVILNFSTQPAWLFVQKKPVTVNPDPDAVQWDYVQGKSLRDPSCGQLADYYARLVSWYTQGGFTDELGKQHHSGYHFKIPWWEVFNEIDVEHQPTPELYTAEYDAIVGKLHALNPDMKFVGLALAFPERDPRMVEYFLNPAHHKPGIPLDMVSFHFYASPTKQQNASHWQYTFFDQADGFISTMRYVAAIRDRLSPATKIDLDEIGSILPTDWHPDHAYAAGPPIPSLYWNLSGALYAYIYIETAKLGIDVVGESQLVGFPSQFPSVTMIDWKTGRPNARYRVLQLIHDSAHPGDRVAAVKMIAKDVDALAFYNDDSRHLLLVNKRARPISIDVPAEFRNGKLSTVQPGHVELQTTRVHASVLVLSPFEVASISSR